MQNLIDYFPLLMQGLRLTLLLAISTVVVRVIIGAILLSARLKLGSFSIFGTEVAVEDLLRDTAMIAVTLVSLAITPKANHEANGFSWTPIAEVAALFAGIFVTHHSGAGHVARRKCGSFRAPGRNGD